MADERAGVNCARAVGYDQLRRRHGIVSFFSASSILLLILRNYYLLEVDAIGLVLDRLLFSPKRIARIRLVPDKCRETVPH